MIFNLKSMMRLSCAMPKQGKCTDRILSKDEVPTHIKAMFHRLRMNYFKGQLIRYGLIWLF
jgi:hypothetical protein